MPFKVRSFLMLALLVAVPSVAFGRIRQVWTYDRMRNESDLVVNATPVSSTFLEEKVSLPNLSPVTHVVGVETKLEIRLVFKGESKEKNISLHHYALQNPADGRVRGAPQLVSFDPKQHTSYLMFLKHEANGRYVPVTGQTDPGADCIIKLDSGAQ